MFKKIKLFLMLAMAVLTIIGVVTFSQFILEESLQTIMFGTWAAQDAGDWEHVLAGADAMAYTNRVLKVVTNCFGWINPFAFVSYRHYANASDYYIESLRSKVMANRPELMAGRVITVTFKPKSAQKTQENGKNMFILRAGRLNMLSDSSELSARSVTGKLVMVNGRLFIE